MTREVCLTAQDVRSLQLAKAAVAAGIDVLLAVKEMESSDIDGLYLAGGFGSYVDTESAMKIGMLPRIEKISCTVLETQPLPELQ